MLEHDRNYPYIADVYNSQFMYSSHRLMPSRSSFSQISFNHVTAMTRNIRPNDITKMALLDL